ncbi:tetratricopeptide repeat protein (macronuclear) [Tetrahymena thermophila SB210]|uniref:Tetratricopeptide repeat protein n=1 Tax=Tetrahymena thermophila (strain SB210) TaxID=312017 RepID=I7M7Z3_TETTS|nr:tetratricopeptide repeat protein [Tetrahymena thermophila SB210]EAR96311.2 tetratricopeptide repeat protein [Tetrahymena thermophila SB210]|eukprot:XP_001016556.2 tetratricopeptide repeat protein [Tetrahymena thermophila SB210]
MIKQQTIQKKTIENDLKYCINSLSPNLIQLSQSISQIKKLCQSRAKLQLQLLQGDKICIFCQGYNDRLDQQDQNQVKYLKCKKCQQTYHEDCILQTIEHSFQVQKKQIEGTEDYDQLAKLKPTFQIVCLRCDSQDCFSEEINAKKINYIQQLNQICQKVRDQVYDQIVEEKKKLGSCQICNFLWLKRQAEHQIFECDLDKDDEFLQEIKNYEENPQIAKKKIKLSNCKHIFCQNCLSDKVLDKQILQEDYNLCCQAENCKSELTFQEIFVILGSKFNWYMKYKHQKFLIEELSKIKNEIQFVRCRGVYKLAKQNCLGIKLQNRQDIINSIKEIHQLEQQIIYENSNILPDLKAIKSVQFNDQESIQCCNRVYQVIRNKQLDMKAFFEQIVNQTQCENEKKERKNMYDQYLESYIKPFPDHENQPENDCYLITCEDENCQFQFCVNGCLDIHNAINQCPNADRYNDNINIFNIDLNDVVKNFGASTLHFKQVDGSVILTNSVKCFRCFREIQRESKNDENQEQPKCKCFEEYNKIQNNNNQEIHQNYYQQIQIDDQNNLNNNDQYEQEII